MVFQQFRIDRRIFLSGMFLLVFCLWSVSIFFLYIVSEYRIDQHRKLYKHGIKDLPVKDINYFNSRRIDYDGWTPGTSKLLLDPTEFHTKFKTNDTITGFHEILYYNFRPDHMIIPINKMFDSCQYRNCRLTVDRHLYNSSSAVIFELSYKKIGHAPTWRPKDQIWIFHDSEPPCINGKWDHRHRSWDGQFNWSMSYRIDQHHTLYTHRVLDLPGKDLEYFNSRRINYDGWTLGSSKLLLDPTEFYTKFKTNDTVTGFHEILYYDRPEYVVIPENSMFDSCQYKNCHLSVDRTLYNSSSAVIFEISHRVIGHAPTWRPKDQIWIFFDYEPPCINGKWDHRHRSWDGQFNWSMTYRLDSDIFRPYGYLRTRDPSKVPNTDYHAVFTRKTKFAAWIVSHCITMSERENYVRQLQKYIPVDIYGKCGSLKLGRTPEAMKETLKDYKFFLGFENSFCMDYVTEKFFQFFFLTDAVLILRGGADYDNLFPEYTHINANHFRNARDLALYLIHLNNTESEYVEYLQERDKYDFGNMNWACNLCIKLNHKQSFKRVYNNIVDWWHVDKCWSADDVMATWSAKQKHSVIAIIFVVLVCFITVSIKCLRKWYNNQKEMNHA